MPGNTSFQKEANELFLTFDSAFKELAFAFDLEMSKLQLRDKNGG